MTMKQYKANAKRIAKQLGYIRIMPDICARINAATSETEVTRILTTARHMMP